MKSVASEPEMVLEPLRAQDLDAMMSIEVQAYAFPWSRGNFVDSLVAGYRGQALWRAPVSEGAHGERSLLAYSWAMPGVDEVHLLNLTVHPEHRRQGHARRLLDDLVSWATGRDLWWMWLEVRASNDSARRLYEAYGFEEAGLRRGYYPRERSTREDAVLMRLDMRSRDS